MKPQNKHNPAIILTLVSLLALMALIFPYTNEQSTGMVSKTQYLRTVPYPKMYEQSVQTPYSYVTTDDPCKLVKCGARPVAKAHPVLDIYNKPLKDEYGRVWCKCDGTAELYYKIETTRKY